jgi:hypothetical protein
MRWMKTAAEPSFPRGSLRFICFFRTLKRLRLRH